MLIQIRYYIILYYLYYIILYSLLSLYLYIKYREFSYDASKSGGIDAQIETASQELNKVRLQCIRWCKSNFGEVLSAAVHLKMVRSYVESVLR